MVEVKATDAKTFVILDDRLRPWNGSEGQRMFGKYFPNRAEAKDYCNSMHEQHPNVEFWIYEENHEPEKVVFGSYEENRETVQKINRPPAPAISNVRDKSYIVRHWHGDLPLGISYWVNTVLVTVILTTLIAALIKIMDFTAMPRVFSLMLIAMWAILYVVTPWQIVGCWLSAENHIMDTNRYFWARIVQFLVFLGAINSIYIFFTTAWPQVTEYTKIATRYDTSSKYKIRVLRQGTEIEVSGGIGFGLTDAISKHLEANPNIRVIHLNSSGGRVGEARILRDLIQSRNLITYSSKGCFSACVIAFMGGTNRILHEDAQLGFHQGSFPGITADQISLETEKDRTFLLSAGVDSSFVQKAFSTPHHDMWMPPKSELLKAGVITEISDGSRFAKTAPALGINPNEVEKTLLEIPVYRTIQRYDPETYTKIVEAMRTSIKRGDSRSKFITLTRIQISKLMVRYLPYASDDAIIEFTKAIIAEMNHLGIKSGNLCYAYLFPQESNPIDISRYLSKELQQARLISLDKVIETGATNPQILPPEDQVLPDLDKVIDELFKKYGNDVSLLEHLESPHIDKAKVCTLSSALYEETLKLPRKEGVNLLRYLYAGG